MNLRWKILAAIGLAIVCLNLALFVVSHFFILGSYAELEEQVALQNLDRVLNALQNDIAELSRDGADEASWDATYAFIENGDRKYIDSDMVSLADLRLNLVIFIDSTGRVVFGKGYDFENETELPASKSLFDYVASNDRLWRHADTESHSEGVVLSPEGPMIIASRPILTSKGEGPVRGALILGRLLSQGEVARLAERTSQPLALDPRVQLFDLPGKDPSPSEASGMRVLPVDGQTLLGVALIRDIDGKPALVLRMDITRNIYRRGRATTDYFLAWSLLVSLIVGLMSYRLLVKLFSSRQELQQSEERFRSIFEIASAGMSIISPDGRILQVNPALCEFLGCSEEELLGRTIEEITHPDDRTVTVANYCHLFEGRCQALHYEKRYLRKDGQVPWGHASVACVQDREGAPSYCVALVQDMTDRKRAENELRESEERFRAFFEQAAVGVAQVTPDGNLLRVNKKFCDIVGYSREEIQERTFQDITHPDDLDADMAYVRQILAGEIQTYSMEKRYIRKEGTPIWINLTVALRRDPEGNPNYFISVVEDISQRKQAEEALRKSEANIKAIFNNVAAGIDVVDAEGRFVDVNDRLAEMLGYAKNELIGKSPIIFTHPEDRQKSQKMLKKVLNGQLKAYRLEKRYVRKDDSVFWGDLAFTRVVDGKGEVEADIGIVFDVTERKVMEERLKAANRELEAFVYTVSHDLRTPLTPILGYADFLRESYRERLDEQALECLAQISVSGNKMLRLMEDLLDLAKVGHLERPAEPVDTDEVVRKVLKDLGSRNASVGATVQTVSLPTQHVPETLLTQIFDNLIGNAIRYAGREGSPIEVGGERRGDLVRLYVRDHGPGIPEEERSRIFEAFYRGATGKMSPGTGVGLATVQKIARLYGGRAWVEETDGGGSTFWVEMVDVPTAAENEEDILQGN